MSMWHAKKIQNDMMMNTTLPRLYKKKDIAAMDQLMIQQYCDNGYQLMNRAARAVVEVLLADFPQPASLLVVCGQGNNAGDGYVIARLMKSKGYAVSVCSLIDENKLKNDAQKACQDWQERGGRIIHSLPDLHAFDAIVDAILGTGLDRPLSTEWNHYITRLNESGKPIIAVDIPSGLDADTGQCHGQTIRARKTITFIARKSGLYTGKARNYCGEIIFADLDVPDAVYQQFTPLAALLNWHDCQSYIPPRAPCAHKGDAGKVLIIGGNQGMPGAVIMAAMAALRSGAGLVRIVTHPAHAPLIPLHYPEIISQSYDLPESSGKITELLSWADNIVLGPGLGQDAWAQALFQQVCAYQKQAQNGILVIDADGLNLLATYAPAYLPRAVITPHPGEAARLLAVKIKEIEANRYNAVRQLHRFADQVVLKGAGTIISNKKQIFVCNDGNEGMASAGMGDCLSAIIATLAKNINQPDMLAACAACLHAKAADHAAAEGKTGMIASDLWQQIRALLP